MDSIYHYGRSLMDWINPEEIVDDAANAQHGSEVAEGWVYVVPGEEGDYPSSIDVPAAEIREEKQQHDASVQPVPAAEERDVFAKQHEGKYGTEERGLFPLARIAGVQTSDRRITGTDVSESLDEAHFEEQTSAFAMRDFKLTKPQPQIRNIDDDNGDEGLFPGLPGAAEATAKYLEKCWQLLKSPKAMARSQRKRRQHPQRVIKRTKIQNGSKRNFSKRSFAKQSRTAIRGPTSRKH